MLLFAHLGIGSRLATEAVKPFRLDLPFLPLLVGTIAPDLFDKALYYGLVFITGKTGLDLGLMSGTRTFGHTAVVALSLAVIASASRSSKWAAFALGVATHLLLDSAGDHLLPKGGNPASDGLLALAWPFLGWQFPVFPYGSVKEATQMWLHPALLGGEIAGAALLVMKYFKLHKPR